MRLSLSEREIATCRVECILRHTWCSGLNTTRTAIAIDCYRRFRFQLWSRQPVSCSRARSSTCQSYTHHPAKMPHSFDTFS